MATPSKSILDGVHGQQGCLCNRPRTVLFSALYKVYLCKNCRGYLTLSLWKPLNAYTN